MPVKVISIAASCFEKPTISTPEITATHSATGSAIVSVTHIAAKSGYAARESEPFLHKTGRLSAANAWAGF